MEDYRPVTKFILLEIVEALGCLIIFRVKQDVNIITINAHHASGAGEVISTDTGMLYTTSS